MLPPAGLTSLADATLADIVGIALSPQACGYFASLLVFATFWMQRMAPLRLVAICSNLAFFAYAVRLGLTPIAILHAVPPPLAGEGQAKSRGARYALTSCRWNAT